MIQANPIIGKVIGVAVVLIVITMVTVPILGGFTESSPGETGVNDTSVSLNYAYVPKDGTSISITDDGVSFNGTYANVPNDFYIVSDNFMLRSSSGGENNDAEVNGLYWYSSTLGDYKSSINLTISDGRITGTFTDWNEKPDQDEPTVQTVDCTYTAIAVINSREISGDWIDETKPYVAWDGSTGSVYVDEDAVLFARYANSAIAMGDYLGLTFVTPGDDEPTGTFTLTTGEPSGDAVQITGMVGGVGSKVLFVPQEYYIEAPQPATISGSMAQMIDMIPLLMTIGLIVAVVAAFITLKSRGDGA